MRKTLGRDLIFIAVLLLVAPLAGPTKTQVQKIVDHIQMRGGR